MHPCMPRRPRSFLVWYRKHCILVHPSILLFATTPPQICKYSILLRWCAILWLRMHFLTAAAC